MEPFRLLAEPQVLIPVAAVLISLLAYAGRVRPRLRPLVGPAAAAAVGITAVSLGGSAVREAPLASLVYLLPLLVLFVRAIILLGEGLIRRRHEAEPPALLGSVLSVALYGVGAGTVARIWFGVDLTPFVATSAVVGAVVALALQDTLGNLFAGIALHAEAPFHVGDWVRVGDHDGRVEQISWRATRLRTWEGDALTVPNGEVARHPVLNYAEPRGPHLRRLGLSVTYHTPPNRVLAVLREVLAEVEGLPPEPAPRLRVAAFQDSSILYEIHYPYPDFEDWRRLEGEIHRLVWYHFRRHGIEIPFPMRNVLLHRVRGVSEGDSTSARLARTLRQIDLFRVLSDEEIHQAAARFRAQHYAAGERIIGEGTSGDTFFVIDHGEVEVSRGGRPLARLVPGQFFGEMALLTGEPRTATVATVTDADLFTLDRAGFHDILVQNPAIAEEISAILAARREAHTSAEADVDSAADLRARGEMRRKILQGIRSLVRAMTPGGTGSGGPRAAGPDSPTAGSTAQTLLADLLRTGADPGALRRALERLAPSDSDLRTVARRAPPPLIAVLAAPPWAERPLVLGGLVMNPRTPRALALRFVGQLYWRDLAEVAAAAHLAPGVRSRAEQHLRDLCPDLRLGDRTTLARLATPPVLRVLLADPDRRVVHAGLENPRLTESELATALRTAVSEVLPTATGGSWRWQDSYLISVELVLQSRTPLGVALARLARLVPRDLARVVRERGASTLLRAEAERRLAAQVPPHEGV